MDRALRVQKLILAKVLPQLCATYPTKSAIYCKTCLFSTAFGILDQLTGNDFTVIP